MSLLTGLTALDILLVLNFLAIVGYGAYTGLIRQLLLLAAVYLGVVLASQLFGLVARGLRLIGPQVSQETLEPIAFILVFFVSALVIYGLTRATYPETRLRRRRTLDHLGGAIAGSVLGALVTVGLFMALNFLTSFDWVEADDVRRSIRIALTSSRLEPFLLSYLSPLYHVVSMWLPQGLSWWSGL